MASSWYGRGPNGVVKSRATRPVLWCRCRIRRPESGCQASRTQRAATDSRRPRGDGRHAKIHHRGRQRPELVVPPLPRRAGPHAVWTEARRAPGAFCHPERRGAWHFASPAVDERLSRLSPATLSSRKAPFPALAPPLAREMPSFAACESKDVDHRFRSAAGFLRKRDRPDVAAPASPSPVRRVRSGRWTGFGCSLHVHPRGRGAR